MIIVTANARNAIYTSNDLITSGSIGIPVTFNLSDDFAGLSNVAVFEGSGVSVDVLIVNNACVVPHEVLASAGGYLRVGVYGRNAGGTIAIPTVWAGTMPILQGVEPSDIDPAAPTPDWTAQVQAAAVRAVELAQSVVDAAERGDFDGVSPTVTVTDISGGHRVTVTDADGTRSFDVLDGTDGEDGRGIASAVLNADYTLTLTYTDGTSYTTPSLRGEPGENGISPVASVSKTGKVATITITDKNGTTTATVSDGEDGTNGTNGVSPSVAVTSITGGHRVTVTDADGAHSFDVMNGEDYVLTQQDKADIAAEVDVPVTDVQVNGTSILNNGVANIVKATDSQVKAGTENGKILVPSLQDASAFYGLAKAAGSDMASSSNPVGTYTDAAKVAIQKMLGIRPVGDFEEIARYSVTENSDIVIVNTDLNGNAFKLANAIICIKLGTPTTGTNDYVLSGFFDENGTYRGMPTLRWISNLLSNTWLIFQFNSFNGMPVVHGKATASGNAQASQMATYNSTSGGISFNKIDCMTGVRFSKYGTSTSPIPAGSEIFIYGCRLYD